MECPFGHSRFLERRKEKKRVIVNLFHGIKSLSDQEEEGRRKKRNEEI